MLDRFIKKKQFLCENKKNLLKSLSNRELDLLKLIIKGNTTKDIPDKLNISVNTVNIHRANLLKKCQTKNAA
jgi:two-component system response regulator TtrR